jgi:hypothetical protein
VTRSPAHNEGFPPYRSGAAADKLRVMTHRIGRTKPIAGHAYSVPVVRELPLAPMVLTGPSTW